MLLKDNIQRLNTQYSGLFFLSKNIPRGRKESLKLSDVTKLQHKISHWVMCRKRWSLTLIILLMSPLFGNHGDRNWAWDVTSNRLHSESEKL